MMVWRDHEAATTVEYAIMVSLVALTIVVAVLGLGAATQGFFCDAAEAYPNSGTTC
jgi:Flp pilus assembly pilin Flp